MRSASSAARVAALLAAAIVVAVLLFQMARSLGSTQDDAFITYRYSSNLAQGQGLVYNPGERVEGYTNFLWTVLIAGVVAAGGDPVAIAPYLGAACAIGVVCLLLFAAGGGRNRAEGEKRGFEPARATVAGVAGGLFYVAGSAVAAEGVQGLETPLFAFLVTAALLTDARERENGRRSAGVSGWLYALAALTRPEGAMAFGVAALLRAPAFLRGSSDEPHPISRRSEVLWAASALTPILLHELFRLAYYGDYVPNTAHAKVSFSAAILARGLAYLGSFLLAYAPVVVLAGLGAFLDRASVRTRLLASWCVLDMVYVAWVGGDYKPTFRFFAAMIPSLCLLAGQGLTLIGRTMRSRTARPIVLVTLATATAVFLWIRSAPAREFTEWRRSLLPVHTTAGRWLKAHFPPGTLVATINAGVLPYYSSLPTIDMLGLCDREIARRPAPPDSPEMAGHEKGDGAYVLSRRPDVILFMQARFSRGPLPESEVERLAWGVSEREILGIAAFRHDYEWRSEALPGFYLNYYQRRDAGGVPPSPVSAPFP